MGRITRKELEHQAAVAGLYMAAYSPGDGVTRYRFFLTPRSYFQSDGLFTALGTREAMAFVRGFWSGRVADDVSRDA